MKMAVSLSSTTKYIIVMMHLSNLLVITEAIMDLHQRVDVIKMMATSLVVSDHAMVARSFHQTFKEIVISKSLIIVPCSSYTRGLGSYLI